MIDYHIATYNEDKQLDKLISYLKEYLSDDDKIVITVDTNRVTQEVLSVIRKHEIIPWGYAFDIKNPNGQFQFYRKLCNNQYLFLLSADEKPHNHLMTELSNLIKQNPAADCFMIPRMNIISDLTHDNVDKMYVGNRPKGYLLKQVRNEHGWIAWPDYQCRIVKNVDYIYYGPHTHSGMVGFKQIKRLPAQPEYGLWHTKTVAKQSQSNRICDGVE